MRVLLSTFGPTAENTLIAMRALRYDKLVLVLSQEDMDTPGYREVRDTEAKSLGQVQNIFVDKYDFQDCFRNIVDFVQDLIRGLSRKDRENSSISINISGGSKIMGDAALLAAFQVGIQAYHCEKGRVIKFPVIEGVSLRDRFTDPQIAVLKEIGARDTIDDITKRLVDRLTEDTIRKSLRKLKKMGVIQTKSIEGRIVTELTESGIFILETLNRLDRTPSE